MILIYSKCVDEFVNQVLCNLINHNFIKIGLHDVVKLGAISINESTAINIKTSFKEEFELSQIKSIWFNGGQIQDPQIENISNELKVYLDNNYSTIIEGYLTFSKAFKIGRTVNQFECTKMDVLLYGQKCGFLIPDTLFTENKSDLVKFQQKYFEKGIISKRINDKTHFYENNQVYNLVNTFEVSDELLINVPNTFGLSQFQQKIERQYEVRVLYLLGNCYAMAIFTSDIIDYRINLNKNEEIRMVPFDLGNTEEQKLNLLMNKLNLNYASIDFIVDYNDVRYLLEVNPCGQVGFLNEVCNYYLENKISELLINANKI